MTTAETSVMFPPANVTFTSETSGTVTSVSCGGPIDAEIRSAAGTLLAAFKAPAAASFPVSVAFTGGTPYIVQRTPSDITLTF
ncbi:hypothetical protein [Paraburkholderia sp. BCC1884]|uniref:hypothetical protein n=1 Tax=Paraburkholderia sp. BCC1884 TaxID=2562668 RepID=UPI0011838CC2|nr:hypothetical protein [Paraburkholderia sp. BCC1884]